MYQTDFEESYRYVYQDMYRFALYTLGNSHDAEDAVSDAVVDAYAGFSRLRNPESFRPWIFKILTVKCKRKLKEYANKTLELDESAFLDSKEEHWNVEENQDIRSAFFTLSGQERLIVSMSVFGGYTSKEIGGALFIKDATVRSKLSRALEKMQKKLES